MTSQNHKNTNASIKNLEVQISQLVKKLVDNQIEEFKANTPNNLKDQCNNATKKLTGRRTLLTKMTMLWRKVSFRGLLTSYFKEVVENKVVVQ
jgi:hypothetical protein